MFLCRSIKWQLSECTFGQTTEWSPLGFNMVNRVWFVVCEFTPLGSHTVALKKEPQSFGLWIWLQNKAKLGLLLSLPVEIHESIPFGFMKWRWGTGQPVCGFSTRALTCGERGICQRPEVLLSFYLPDNMERTNKEDSIQTRTAKCLFTWVHRHTLGF